MSKSIMSNEKKCYLCGSDNVHRHHCISSTEQQTEGYQKNTVVGFTFAPGITT